MTYNYDLFSYYIKQIKCILHGSISLTKVFSYAHTELSVVHLTNSYDKNNNVNFINKCSRVLILFFF